MTTFNTLFVLKKKQRKNKCGRTTRGRAFFGLTCLLPSFWPFPFGSHVQEAITGDKGDFVRKRMRSYLTAITPVGGLMSDGYRARRRLQRGFTYNGVLIMQMKAPDGGI